jgi:hypothetical protein
MEHSLGSGCHVLLCAGLHFLSHAPATTFRAKDMPNSDADDR